MYQTQGNFSQAVEYYLKDLAIARDIGDRRGEAHALGNIATAYASLKNFPKATEYGQQHLKLTRSTGDRTHEQKH